ncbi:hypothetical protein [Streptomyces sp. NPDC053367]|uniref:hypothetical protein n=1 Tax=Streptomyces sp. NPDC053367 TaxID=3365700 RepID=UPI0037CD38C5
MDHALAAAVRRGDAEQVRTLLDDGADPDTPDPESGLPLLCTAVAAYEEPVAEALRAAGADALRPLPDGSTPLLRALDSGSPWLTLAVLPDRAAYPGPLREQLLERARHWARTGAEAELRRRTGLTEPAVRTRLHDTTGCWYERLELGGLALHDGHLATLTVLETRFGLRVPFDELMARALAYPDRGHLVWSQVMHQLGRRPNERTWAAATRLSESPDPLLRLFAADVLLSLVIGDVGRGRDSYAGRAGQLAPWALREPDPAVLDVLLNALTWADGPEIQAVGLACRAHPDPRIRAWVPNLLSAGEALGAGGLAAVRVLARDPDAGVRASVCHWLCHQGSGESAVPGIGDMLWDLSRDERQRIRIHAVAGLANRDDPRCVEAEARIGPLEEGLADEHLPLQAVWHYRRRREEQRGGG